MEGSDGFCTRSVHQPPPSVTVQFAPESVVRTTPRSLATNTVEGVVRCTSTRAMYEPTLAVPAIFAHVAPPSGLRNRPSP